MKRYLLWSLLVLIVMTVAYQSCTLSEDAIRGQKWKFNDDLPEICEHCDFLVFDGNWLLLRNDTVFHGDSALATVVFSCSYSGRERLFLRGILSGRIIEYVS